MRRDPGLVLESRAAFAIAMLALALFLTAVIETASGVSKLRLMLNLVVMAGIALALVPLTIRIEWSGGLFKKSYLFGLIEKAVFSEEELLSMTIRRNYTQKISRVTLRFANGSLQIYVFQTGYVVALDHLQKRFPKHFADARIEQF
jgi:hypothetical protein